MRLLIATIATVPLVGGGLQDRLISAAHEGDMEAVERHLAVGADVNEKTLEP